MFSKEQKKEAQAKKNHRNKSPKIVSERKTEQYNLQ